MLKSQILDMHKYSRSYSAFRQQMTQYIASPVNFIPRTEYFDICISLDWREPEKRKNYYN